MFLIVVTQTQFFKLSHDGVYLFAVDFFFDHDVLHNFVFSYPEEKAF